MEKVAFDKQELKKQRIKMYFLEAAKDMIINEGVESVSVRKVADVAGYSYATLYNYFKDINELLYDVKQALINDLIELMQKQMNDVVLDIEGIKKIFRIYMAYYFENPNIFKFFFHKTIQSDKEMDTTEVEPDFNAMMKATFKSLVLKGKLNEEDVEIVGKTCIYAVHGMLTLCLTGNSVQSQENLYKELDKMIDYLL